MRDVVYVGVFTATSSISSRGTARRCSGEPRDDLAAGARGERPSAFASRGGRSTRTRSREGSERIRKKSRVTLVARPAVVAGLAFLATGCAAGAGRAATRVAAVDRRRRSARAKAPRTSSSGRTRPTRASPRSSRTRPAASIKRKDAGSSNQMVALMPATGGGRGRRPVRHGLGLGRRQPAAGCAGDVRSVDVDLVPAGRTSSPRSNRRRTTRSTAPLRRLAPVGAEHADVQHRESHARRRRTGARSTARTTRARSPSRTIRSRSRTRPCICPDEAEPGDQGPVRAEEGPARRGHRPPHQ